MFYTSIYNMTSHLGPHLWGVVSCNLSLVYSDPILRYGHPIFLFSFHLPNLQSVSVTSLSNFIIPDSILSSHFKLLVLLFHFLYLTHMVNRFCITVYIKQTVFVILFCISQLLVTFTVGKACCKKEISYALYHPSLYVVK